MQSILGEKVQRFKFTRARLDALPFARKGADWEYFYDTVQPRLAIGVGETVKTFYFVKKIAGRVERIKLERHGAISIDEAREAAGAHMVGLASGHNPAEGRRESRRGITPRQIFDDFLLHRRKRRGGFLAASTKRGYRYDFDNHLAPLADYPAARITREQVAALHSRIGREHPTAANRVLALVGALYAHADDRKLYIGHNPARGVEKFPEETRERFLRPDEFPKFMGALAETPEPWRWMFALGLFTGARRGNVLTAHWSDIDAAARLWRLPSTKRGTPVTLPLSDETIAILWQIPRVAGTDYLFPSHGATGHITEPKKAWADLLDRAGLPDLKIHDLRRSFGSWQAMTGSSLPIIGKSLGHSTAQSTQIYSRLTVQPVVDSVGKATAAMLAAAGKGNRGAAIRKVLGQTRGRK